MSKLEVGETPEQFVERLNRYIVKWCEMAGYDNVFIPMVSVVIYLGGLGTFLQVERSRPRLGWHSQN